METRIEDMTDEERQEALDVYFDAFDDGQIVYMSAVEIYNECPLGDLGEEESDMDNEVILLERKLLEANATGLAAAIASNDYIVIEPLVVENGVLTDGHHRLAVMWDARPYDAIPVRILSD